MHPLIFVVIIVAAVLMLFTLNAPARQSRAAFNNADDLIMQAESAMLRGRYDEAYSFYQRALYAARNSGCGLFEAEAYYGMARIHEKKGDDASARKALEMALSNRQTWADEKPNFANLIERHLEEVNSRTPR